MENNNQRIIDSFKLPFYLVVVMFLIHIFQMLSYHELGYWGIYPREWVGLRGIFFAPLVHASISHLLSNSIPLLVVGTIIMYFYRSVAVQAFIMIYLLTGMAVWLLGRSVFHIGASGVVYGMVAFVFWNGVFRRNLKSVILAAIITLLYSGMFFGIMPNQEGISWESHLLGGLVGIFVSYYFKEELETDELDEEGDYVTLEQPKQPFFNVDTFTMTKDERRRREEESQRFDNDLL
ncbi:MAG: rhomboid family intramembrane serine protease [Saprospiraceae bacterium]|nr:rhomboid family intramembrane serine protease [Saprospiraceae bacterium]